MRPGQKFEITLDMAISNIRTVYARLGVSELSRRLYMEHGSFCIRAIERKWGWSGICQLAGVACGIRGSRKLEWHPCTQCNPGIKRNRSSGLASSRFRYCWECRRKIKRNN